MSQNPDNDPSGLPGLDRSRFTPFSGTMRVSSKEAARQLGLDIENPAFNAWAAAISIRAVKEGIMSKEEYEKTYGITPEEGAELRNIMYGEELR